MKVYPQALADAARRTWRGVLRALGDWRWVGAAAVLMLVASVGFSLVVLVQDRDDARQDRDQARRDLAALQEIVEDGDALTQCRSEAASAVTNATSDYLLAIGDLVIALPEDDRGRIATQLQALETAGRALDDARDARVAFDENPTGDC